MDTVAHLGPVSEAALLLIDVQQAFNEPLWGSRNNPQAEDNIAALLAHWRRHRRQVIHVQHSSRSAGSPLAASEPGFALMDCALPQAGEPVFVKSVNSAFIGTALEPWLLQAGIQSLVIAGFTTDHCVSTSVRMAANLGFRVRLVTDATVAFDKTAIDGGPIEADVVHRVHVASLNGEFCDVVTTQVLLEGNKP